MKKQILFMAFFTLALIFAGNNNVFGQLSPGITSPLKPAPLQPIAPLTCATAANFLHPIAGVSYTYQMDGTTGPEDVIGWTWFATKNPAFIAAPNVLSADSLNANTVGELLEAGGNYGVTGSATNSVSITWSPEILSNTLYQGVASTTAFPSPTFVVGYGKGQNCADNIQVFEINPIQNFTLDIANIDAAGLTLGWDATTAQCVDMVQSATYNSVTNEIDMNYGKDTLYFEVVAANFVTSWTPTFTKISGLNGVQTAELGMAISLANARAGTFLPGGTTNWTAASTNWATGVALTSTLPADVVTGVSVFVRVIISNLTYESVVANPFVLAADAIDAASPAKWDMEEADCTALDNTADQVDQASHTVNPRPQIEDMNVPDSNLLIPNERILKTGGVNN